MENNEIEEMWEILDSLSSVLIGLNKGDKEWMKTTITITLPEVSYKKVCTFTEHISEKTGKNIHPSEVVYRGYTFSFKKIET